MWERDSTQSKNPFTWLCLFSFRGLTGLKITSLAKCHRFNRNSRKSKIELVIEEFPKIQKRVENSYNFINGLRGWLVNLTDVPNKINKGKQ